jgi:hypothetical protein
LEKDKGGSEKEESKVDKKLSKVGLSSKLEKRRRSKEFQLENERAFKVDAY